MSIQALLFPALQASIFLTVLSVGMGTSGADLQYVLSKPSRLVRSLLAVLVSAVAVMPTRSGASGGAQPGRLPPRVRKLARIEAQPRTVAPGGAVVGLCLLGLAGADECRDYPG